MTIFNLNELNNKGKVFRIGARAYMVVYNPNAYAYEDNYGVVDLSSGQMYNFEDFIDYVEKCGYAFINHDAEDEELCDYYGVEEITNFYK